MCDQANDRDKVKLIHFKHFSTRQKHDYTNNGARKRVLVRYVLLFVSGDLTHRDEKRFFFSSTPVRFGKQFVNSVF